MKQQAGGLRCLASKDWGYEKSILRSTYIATGRSNVEYAAAAWLPWVSISTLGKLEMCQRYAGRAITGQMKTTPVEAILEEADLPIVATWATQLSTIAMEKVDGHSRSPPAHEEDKLDKERQRGREIYLWVHTTRKGFGALATQATN